MDNLTLKINKIIEKIYQENICGRLTIRDNKYQICFDLTSDLNNLISQIINGSEISLQNGLNLIFANNQIIFESADKDILKKFIAVYDKIKFVSDTNEINKYQKELKKAQDKWIMYREYLDSFCDYNYNE